jgi:hypothetical protein
MRTGISKLITILTAAAAINDAARQALADGKITPLEWFGLALNASQHFSVVGQFAALKIEVLDLTEDEADALSDHFALVWRVPKPVAEARWKATFEYLTNTVVFINRWRTAQELAV